MSEWKSIGSHHEIADAAASILSFGAMPLRTITTVENKNTGEIKEVAHYTKEGLGENISKGKFLEKKD